MNIIYDNSLSVEDYLQLRKSAGWGVFPKRQAQAGINNSAYVIAARADGKTIAMARVITDGGYVAFIMDVVVLPEYQGQGIGSTMLQMIMTYLRNMITDDERMNVCLMSAKGKEGFYKQFGFLERPNDKMGAGMSMFIKGEQS